MSQSIASLMLSELQCVMISSICVLLSHLLTYIVRTYFIRSIPATPTAPDAAPLVEARGNINVINIAPPPQDIPAPQPLPPQGDPPPAAPQPHPQPRPRPRRTPAPPPADQTMWISRNAEGGRKLRLKWHTVQTCAGLGRSDPVPIAFSALQGSGRMPCKFCARSLIP